ncbi:nucleotide-binding universal stress UspA family protein [Constrictibacter sp. MBR-5]|uniref:universal stress protein n=1 Tax=Constrictibacter sp. MBR-5 TaxID=3156467 RepID=UPI003399D790
MKNILVPVNESDGLPSMIETAVLVAEMFEGHIEGLRVRQDTSAVLAADDLGAASPALLENFDREEAERGRRAREVFEGYLQGRHRDAGGRFTSSWLQVNASDTDVGGHGRLFDVIVVGRPTRARTSPPVSVLEAALFETGRPILIAPPTPPVGLGKEVVIAWNGSTETALTIAHGMPYLARARQITVLTIEGGTVPGPTGTEVAAKLRRHGFAVDAVTIPPNGRSVGEAILEESSRLGADLLLKGGYTQSRLRQMIFGGATHHILAEATLPVLMAH